MSEATKILGAEIVICHGIIGRILRLAQVTPMTDASDDQRVLQMRVANLTRHASRAWSCAVALERLAKPAVWRCYHCAEAFSAREMMAAREHFGLTSESVPECLRAALARAGVIVERNADGHVLLRLAARQ